MPDTILVVDDELLTRRTLQLLLEQEGFRVATVGTVAEAVAEVDRRPYDLILLDLILPDGDGFAVCRQVRIRHQMPIIILSTKHELNDRVTGLELGADDYIIKPFEPKEVVARVRAQLRRAHELNRTDEATERLAIGDMIVDAALQDAVIDGTPAGLTQKEFRLVHMLASRAGKAVSREQLVDHLWSEEELESDKILAVYVRRVRQKIEKNPNEPKYLVTVRGYGYMLTS
ncbi:MAG TPA: response regulator transcription factor [Thermoanaerobaculia bacterium]|jgi:DNA-binding response OmpR family regulator